MMVSLLASIVIMTNIQIGSIFASTVSSTSQQIKQQNPPTELKFNLVEDAVKAYEAKQKTHIDLPKKLDLPFEVTDRCGSIQNNMLSLKYNNKYTQESFRIYIAPSNKPIRKKNSDLIIILNDGTKAIFREERAAYILAFQQKKWAYILGFSKTIYKEIEREKAKKQLIEIAQSIE